MAEKIPASVGEALPTCANFWAQVVPAISPTLHRQPAGDRIAREVSKLAIQQTGRSALLWLRLRRLPGSDVDGDIRCC
jgi:hypothetical protein